MASRSFGFRLAPVVAALVVAALWGGEPARAQQPSPRSTAALPGNSPAPPAPGAEPRTQRRAAIRFLTDTDYPPFNYYHDDGTLVGFNVDIARAVCQDLNAACDVQVRAWADLLPALKKGEADAVIASHMVTPALVHEFDVTDRYYHTPGRFVGVRGVTRIEATPEGLESRRIGVARGTTHEAYLRAFFAFSSIQTFDNVELAQDALKSGAVDVLFDDAISLSFWLQGTASRACCEFKGEPFYEPRFFGDGVGIAIPKGDTQLKSQINAALRRIRESGKYGELVLRYFPTRAF